MEALVAVGLAGNVVQFVQFSGQLISLAKEIKKKGAPSSLLELRKVTEGLTQQTRVIVTRLKANAATLEQEEQHLLDVATDCEKGGKEFIAYIDDFMKTSKPSSYLRIVQSSVKIKWHHHHIEAYISRVDKLQGSLLLATTLSLRTRGASNHQEILEHLRSIEAENDASKQSDKYLIRALSLLEDLVQQQSGSKLNILQRQMDSCMRDIQVIRSTITDTREAKILHWLDFRQRTWRFEEVEEAHRTTFEWVFQKPRANTPWHDFGDYLSGADTSLPYFINGKAGSGKSTLMKYIISHPKTKAGLKKWAGHHTLLSPHFFFWNVGTQLQKSHTGLLRSLLHSILAEYQDLIPAVFPTLYASGTPISDEEAFSYIELKGAFERMKIRSASFLRICIFIDGVDEFEGDHRDMSTFLCSLASSTIKVVVSSRPINACLNVFRGCPTLRLQDLTHDDMHVFIRDRLGSHPMMAELQDESPEKATTLKAEIQEKAEGVFLWVRLVTGLLLRGLEDGDDFDDLLPKLRALPTDLRELYNRMMQKMPSEYQVQASQMFQIFEWWRLNGNDEPLELLLLSFAIQQPHIAISSSKDTCDTQKKRGQSERMASRVRSRCCGLLEVREMPTSNIFWPPTPMVAYLHRSVAEFVASQDVWEQIHSLTIDTRFNPGTHIACGLLSILKSSHPLPDQRKGLRAPSISMRKEYFERILDLAMDACRRNTAFEESFILQYMEAVDKTMALKSRDLRWNSLDQQTRLFSTHWSIQMGSIYLGQEIQCLTDVLPLSAQANIHSFAAHKGILPYLKAVNRLSRLENIESLIVLALGSWKNEEHLFLGQRETLWFLLRMLGHRSQLGIEIPIGQNTLWELAVLVADELFSAGHREYRNPSVLLPTAFMGIPQTPFRPSSPSGFSFKISNTDDPFPSSIRGERSVHNYSFAYGNLGQNIPLELLLTDRTYEGNHTAFQINEQRKRKFEEQASDFPETNFARDKQRKRENMAAPFDESDNAFLEVPEEHLLKSAQRDDRLFECSARNDRPDRIQKGVDILRLFMSITGKRTELLNKAISMPGRPTFTAFPILREVLSQGRKGQKEWASKSEYQFLYQLVGLPEVC
ncbi:hypothetical protein yc1106_04774 [Curvularia clavata]|uniref:NACHT domain-containing protein n=1 Tax=Curvularia clavata TaxID=95742 RepID=A0A9Q9DT01_CURCL|nr:hypothetical protein yc1106_04774 [Curvularia clavata]